MCPCKWVKSNSNSKVWSTDITYIRLASGFAYLMAIIDWYSSSASTARGKRATVMGLLVAV